MNVCSWKMSKVKQKPFLVVQTKYCNIPFVYLDCNFTPIVQTTNTTGNLGVYMVYLSVCVLQTNHPWFTSRKVRVPSFGWHAMLIFLNKCCTQWKNVDGSEIRQTTVWMYTSPINNGKFNSTFVGFRPGFFWTNHQRGYQHGKSTKMPPGCSCWYQNQES